MRSRNLCFQRWRQDDTNNGLRGCRWLLNYVRGVADGIKSGANKYVLALKLLRKFGSFINEKKAPTGLNVKGCHSKYSSNTIIGVSASGI